LSLDNNQINNLKPLNQLTSLTRLLLGNNRINNIKPLENLISLEYLSINNNFFSLEQIKALQTVITSRIVHNAVAGCSGCGKHKDFCECPCDICGKYPCECPCSICNVFPCECYKPPRRGALLDRENENITISDALHILMFLAEMNCSILFNADGTPARGTPAWEAAFISSCSRTAFSINPDTSTPKIVDALHILLYLAKMPSMIDSPE
ncbi:MAG: hypothetical protein FWG33_05150, partial [Oscillospiraceae bacterium]|nr:hypothetical protein [Oscillospiraceae bacterium]